jgi:hypothetical protein
MSQQAIMKKRFFFAASMDVPLVVVSPDMIYAASRRKSRAHLRHVQPATPSDMHAVGQR